MQEFDRQAARAYAEDPRATAAAFSTAGKVVAVGAANAFRLGARVASRHPKVFLASLLVPYVASFAQPCVAPSRERNGPRSVPLAHGGRLACARGAG